MGGFQDLLSNAGAGIGNFLTNMQPTASGALPWTSLPGFLGNTLGILRDVGAQIEPKFAAIQHQQLIDAALKAHAGEDPTIFPSFYNRPDIARAFGYSTTPGTAMRPEDLYRASTYDPYAAPGTYAPGSPFASTPITSLPTNLPPPVATPDKSRMWLEQANTGTQLMLQQNPGALAGAGGLGITGIDWGPHGPTYHYGYAPPPRTLPPPPPPEPAPAGPSLGREPAKPERHLERAPAPQIAPQDGDTIHWPVEGGTQSGTYDASTHTITSPDGRVYSWDPNTGQPPQLTSTAPAPAPTAPAPAPAPAPATPAPTPAPSGAPGAATAAPPPAAAAPAPAAPPLSPDLDAARKRLEDRYGPPPPPPPAPPPVISPPPSTAPAPEPAPAAPPPQPALPAPPREAYPPGTYLDEHFRERRYGEPPGPQATLPGPPPGVEPGGAAGYAPAAPQPAQGQPAPAPAPAPAPEPPGTQEAQPEKPSQLAGDIRDAISRYPEFRDYLQHQYHMDPNKVPDATLLQDARAVNQGYRARSDREFENKSREATIKGSEADIAAAGQAHLARVNLHRLFMQPVGTAPDGRSIIGMDAAPKNANWAMLANVPGVARVIGPAADMPMPFEPRSMWSIERMANEPSLGPWQKAAANYLDGTITSIQIARALGTSGRINQTELNILNRVAIPSEASTYARAMQQYKVLDSFLADVENNVPEAERQRRLEHNADKLEKPAR